MKCERVVFGVVRGANGDLGVVEPDFHGPYVPKGHAPFFDPGRVGRQESRPNFGGLVLGCIGADFLKY